MKNRNNINLAILSLSKAQSIALIVMLAIAVIVGVRTSSHDLGASVSDDSKSVSTFLEIYTPILIIPESGSEITVLGRLVTPGNTSGIRGRSVPGRNTPTPCAIVNIATGEVIVSPGLSPVDKPVITAPVTGHLRSGECEYVDTAKDGINIGRIPTPTPDP